jgi:hypothetical protein
MAGPLSGDVTVPKVGKFPKVAVVLGVGGVIALIVWERRKTTSSAAADPYPPDGTTGNPADPNSTDPATGATYGNEAAGYGGALSPLGSGSLSGYAGASGYAGSGDPYPWDGTYGNPADPHSMDTATGVTYGDEGSTGASGSQPAGPPFSTNAQWSQYALNYFSQNQYADLAGRTDAVGLYIAGQPVTAQQATYVHDAVAIAGNPPVAGPGNFPPSIRATSSTSASGAPGQSPTFSVTPYKGYANFGWSAVTRALDYELLIAGHTNIDRSVRGLNAEHVTLAAGKYTAKVRARNGSGQGPWSAAKTFTVK